ATAHLVIPGELGSLLRHVSKLLRQELCQSIVPGPQGPVELGSDVGGGHDWTPVLSRSLASKGGSRFSCARTASIRLATMPLTGFPARRFLTVRGSASAATARRRRVASSTFVFRMPASCRHQRHLSTVGESCSPSAIAQTSGRL